nr:DNA alkylation repair protein [Bacteroidia bacterium]
MTAKDFLVELSALKSKLELDNVHRFFRYVGKESKFIGVKMSKLFALAKKFIQMPLKEIEKLLMSEYYEARM